tara:strand:+ start:21833 stop:22687 length:855 start_codon:yes stop_codon:yes gene_type:complete
MTVSTDLQCGRFNLDLSRPKIMGILNVTPNSFSDGGRYNAVDRAVARAELMLKEGADLLDIGGESTRPGSQAVEDEEEIRRVLPVLKALHSLNVPLSVDTMKTEVMRAAIEGGVDLINDINALSAPGAMEVVAPSQAAVCLMHMQGLPRTMQQAPCYENVVNEVGEYLTERADAALAAGIDRSRIILDPGFGFGKKQSHNLALFDGLSHLIKLEYPLLVGVSRKTMLGELTGRPLGERQVASVAAALLAVERGARVVRVHDVAATRDALKVWEGLGANRERTTA